MWKFLQDLQKTLPEIFAQRIPKKNCQNNFPTNCDESPKSIAELIIEGITAGILKRVAGLIAG